MDKKLTKAQIEEFSNILCALSPENLHCDGEISPAQAQKKYVKLMEDWRKLEIKVGRKVSQDEIYKEW
jgi:hypothetical protein